MNDDNNTAIIATIIILVLLFLGLALGLSKVDWEKPINLDEETSQVDDNTLADVEKTGKIDNQKITAISDGEITLENGTKFKSEKSDCEVGDVIQGYDDEKQSLICVGIKDNQPVTRYVSVPQNNSNDFLTNLILIDYFLGRGNLRNNGYSPTYNTTNNTTVYKGSNGAEITSNKSAKPTTTKPPSTPSKGGNTNNNGGGNKGGTTTGGKGTTGHGGGFGGGGHGGTS